MTAIYYDKLIELYRLLVERQSSNYYILITVILVVFGALVGVNIYYNTYQIKRMIKDKIDEELKILTSEIKEENKQNIDKLFREKEQEIKDLFRVEENKIATLSADTYQYRGEIGIATFFICISIENCIMLKDWITLRNILSILLQYIRTEPLLSEKKIMKITEVKRIVSMLPDILIVERKEILVFIELCTEL